MTNNDERDAQMSALAGNPLFEALKLAVGMLSLHGYEDEAKKVVAEARSAAARQPTAATGQEPVAHFQDTAADGAKPRYEQVAEQFNGAPGTFPLYAAPIADNAGVEQDFCYCNDEISLQIVSGGAAKEGLYGRVTLKIGDEYVEYMRAQPDESKRVMTDDEVRALRRASAVLCGTGHHDEASTLNGILARASSDKGGV
jgi:hypothetical protein